MKVVEILYQNSNSTHPIFITEEILDKIKIGSHINAGYEEPEYGSDHGHDGHYYLEIKFEREENETEKLRRLKKEEKDKEMMKQRRYESYLKLKKEFEHE